MVTKLISKHFKMVLNRPYNKKLSSNVPKLTFIDKSETTICHFHLYNFRSDNLSFTPPFLLVWGDLLAQSYFKWQSWLALTSFYQTSPVICSHVGKRKRYSFQYTAWSYILSYMYAKSNWHLPESGTSVCNGKAQQTFDRIWISLSSLEWYLSFF